MDKVFKIGLKSKVALAGNEPVYISSTDLSEESLLALMESSVMLPGERYRLLDARDKLIRLKTKKNSDLANAKAIVGTCPDMCPEKERYRRTEEHYVSFYEKQGNEPDEKLIIKEYSRSSADQEQPLPHELRPPDVLEMTMNHLVCNVIDEFKADSGVGEWYDFIWNRTRAIRKDIAQQDLCDLRCVSLVEKCARFHIHCAAVMCEEDASTFDPKINNINLTKSLQTLKYLYHDLMLKGITCKNEAEFRAYDVLLNLNEGDILRQIQQYPDAVRLSPEVKFANKLFSALNSHNYVRFFRLARSASYLNSCILQRYFPQVRQRALQAIVKSYCMPSHIGQYSLEEFVRILAFEGEDEARGFCAWLGLYIDDENNVVLDRNSFAIPTTPPPVVRAFLLIESKRNGSVGEIIHGGPLPPNPMFTYIPYSSFDDTGKLKKEPYNASDQGSGSSEVLEDPQPEVAPLFASQYSEAFNVPRDFSLRPSLHFEIQPIREEKSLENKFRIATDHSDIIQEIASEIVDAIVDSLATHVASKSIYEGCVYDEATHILTSVTSGLDREIAEEVLEEETEVKEQERAHLERQRAVVAELKDELIHDVTKSETKIVAQSVYNEERLKLVDGNARRILDDVIDEAVCSLVHTVAAETHERERKRRVLLQLLRDRADLARARRYFKRWHLISVRRRKLRNTRKSFPPGPPLILPAKKIRKPPHLYSSLVTAQKKKQHISNLIDGSLCAALIEDEVSWQPVNVVGVIHQAIKHGYGKTNQNLMCWKLLILLPLSNDPSVARLCEWIRAKLYENPETITDDEFETVRIEYDVKTNVAISIIAAKTEMEMKSVQQVRDSRKLYGSSSVLLLFTVPESEVELENEITKMRKHLGNILGAKPSSPSLGLQIFLFPSQKVHQPVDAFEQMLSGPSGLDLSQLVAKNLIRTFRVNWLEAIESVEASFQLEEGILWLANNSPQMPNLTSAYLKDFLEDGLQLLVLDPLYSATAEYLRAPETIILLFNEAMRHLASVISKPQLGELSWPAPELCRLLENIDSSSLDWNSKKQLESLQRVVTRLQLPHYDFQDFLAPQAIPDLWTFVESVAEVQDPTIISKIQYLLNRSSNSSEPSIIPWINIFSVVLQYRVSTFAHQDLRTGDTNSTSETVVYFFHDDFMDFHVPSEWVESTRESKYYTAYEELAESRTSGTKHKLEESFEDEPSAKYPCWSTIESNQTQDLNANLQLSLSAEKEEAKLFISKLENILLEGSPLRSPTTTPNFRLQQNVSRSRNGNISYSQAVGSIDDRMRLLQKRLSAQKEASSLYEAKLKQLSEM